jgi:hypothetical protein
MWQQWRRPAPAIGIVGGMLVALTAAVALAEMATVILKDGTRRKGDLKTSDTEIIISNVAGEQRISKTDVVSVEWESAPGSLGEEHRRRFSLLLPDDLDAHFALAEWAREKRRFDLVKKQCNYILGLRPDHANARILLELAQRELADQENRDREPSRKRRADQPPGEGLAEPELLSELDIKRMKMFEFPLTDVPKNLRVRFLTQRGQPSVIDLVKGELAAAGELDGRTRERLEKGKPAEQLVAIVEHTGVKHAQRIEINGDPPVFTTLRRKVLPLLTRGCATAGCHGGDNASVFRLPSGATSSEENVYTSFLILDQLPTQYGPLIDRKRPDQSPLITFMLPRTDNDRPHPPTPGHKLTPRLRGVRDPNYEALIEWIESLRVPHPEYELDWPLPPWLAERQERMLPPDASASQPASQPAPGDGG